MLNILDTIQEWIMGILKECIMGNLNGMFDQINTEVGEVAANVGTTPASWNAGVFSMIRNLSDNVVVPIAGMEDIRDVIEELADTRAKAQETTRAIPLYQENARYAREHGELDLFRASHEANIACRDAIEAAIRENFDGMHLSGDAAKGVLAQFGPERVTHVLAATLLDKQHDARFSRGNMVWAASAPMFDTGSRHYDYAINSHPAVLDGFVELARKEMDAAREQPEQPAKKPSIKGQLAAKPVPGERPAKPRDQEAR